MLARARSTTNDISSPIYFSFFSILTFPIYGIFSNNQLHHLTFDQDHHIRYHQIFTRLAPSPPLLTTQWQERLLNFLKNNSQQLNHSHRTGTDFQHKVWQELQAIPYGQTRTYGDIAQNLGSRHLARAIGNACHNNPLVIYTPCHRVVGKKNLGGYAGGAKIKKALLEFEQNQLHQRP